MTETTTPPSPATPQRNPWFSPALVYAFGTGVTMWIVGFLTHIPGLVPPPEATGVLIIAVQIAGALLLGRATLSPLRAGATAGICTALINLLVLGALVAPAGPSDRPDRSAALIVITYLAASTFLGALAAFVGSKLFPPSPRLLARTTRDWLGRFAVITVGAAVPVLLSGALVTTLNAGLSVRDWPSTYGAMMWLYPLAKMTGGIYYEHAHRLFGSLVGLTTIVFLLFTLIADPRKWTRALVLAVFLLVCLQGVLGGLRVTSAQPTNDTPDVATAPAEPVPLNYAQTADTGTSRALAMIHAISAQLTIAALCIAAAVTGQRWRTITTINPHPDPFLRTCTTLLLAALFIQLCLGAATRHFEQIHALWTHMGFAAFVALAAVFTGMRTTMYGRDHRPLRLLGVHIFIFLALQVLLGFLTMMAVLPTYDDSTTASAHHESTAALALATLHQATGAALLAISVVLALWVFRLTTHKPHPARSHSSPQPA